jgi:hypothetical protein
MSVLKEAFWERTGLDETVYRTFIETGSYRGFMIDLVMAHYEVIHSIELSKRWHKFCREKFRGYDHVHLYEGDSRVMLPGILSRIREPAVIFLDAHYSGGSTARLERDTPLLDELDIVAQRPFADIIIVDDTSFLGQKGGSEPQVSVSDDDPWPPFAYDWKDITETEVRKRFKPDYDVVTNAGNVMTTSPREDQFILFPSMP